MNSNISQLRAWYSLAKPNKLHFFISCFAMILAYTCNIISPIFAASAITAITVADYTGAVIYLIIEFIIVALSYLFKHGNFYIYSRLIGGTYISLNNQILNKVMQAKSCNFRKVPKESILNLLHTDIYNVSIFSDKLAIAIAKLFRVIVTIITIFCINWCAGLVVLSVDILNFFILSRLNDKRLKYIKEIRDNADKRCQKMNQIVDSRTLSRELCLREQLSHEYMLLTKKYQKSEHGRTMNQSYVDNLYAIFYYGIILIVTLFMVYMVAGNALNLTLYLIITPYIVSGITIANEAYTVLSDMRTTTIASNRVRKVLNFTEQEFEEFGDKDYCDVFGIIDFKNVCYKGGKGGNNSLNNVSFHIRPYEITLIGGKRGGGKRTIFNMLRRDIKPKSGQILLDNIDLNEYSEHAHRDNFTYINTKPYFYSGSIMKNLKMVCKDTRQIHKICTQIGLEEYILSTPKKYNTEANALPIQYKYLLSFARALLTDCEVVALYEFPSSLTEKEFTLLKSALLYYTEWKLRTFIIFSSANTCENIADKIIEINNGEITSIYLNNK